LLDAVTAHPPRQPHLSLADFWPEPVASLVRARMDDFRAQVAAVAGPGPLPTLLMPPGPGRPPAPAPARPGALPGPAPSSQRGGPYLPGSPAQRGGQAQLGGRPPSKHRPWLPVAGAGVAVVVVALVVGLVIDSVISRGLNGQNRQNRAAGSYSGSRGQAGAVRRLGAPERLSSTTARLTALGAPSAATRRQSRWTTSPPTGIVARAIPRWPSSRPRLPTAALCSSRAVSSRSGTSGASGSRWAVTPGAPVPRLVPVLRWAHVI
jgi:hypothetical protein